MTLDPSANLPRYNRLQTYQWNYDHAPQSLNPALLRPIASVQGDWRYCGLAVDSPLGVPAGPLLNGKWCLYYADLGFDVLTYKTVRSSARACYDLPNLAPVLVGQMQGGEADTPVAAQMEGSWAVSFGMPSQSPDAWRRDVALTKKKLPPGKLLSVSVVGTIQPGWSIEELADDYALCAHWAAESGADVIEVNFSCPNVATCDGQLYQQPIDAALTAEKVRSRIGDLPLIVKIGRVENQAAATELLEAIGPHISALAMTNSIASTIGSGEEQLFAGQPRGVCGEAIHTASVAQVKMFAVLIEEQQSTLQLIGVGGVSSADHLRAYLAAGAHAVHIATAAMVDPLVAVKIRAALAETVDWA